MGFWGWLLVAGMAYLVYAVLGIAYCNISVRKNLSDSGKLQLEKSSWLYKYCFGFFDYFGLLSLPKKISTCSLGARFLLVPILYALIIMLIIAACVGFAALFVTAFLFAARPAIFKEEGIGLFGPGAVVYYKHWPKWRGHQVWPISVVVIFGILFLLGAFIYFIPLVSATTWWILGVAALSVFSVIVVSVLSVVYSRSDNWEAVKQGLKDWKDGVCREVELVDKTGN